MALRKLCSIEGCSRKHKAHGLCDTHYVRFRKHGDPNVCLRVLERQDIFCSVDDCLERPLAKGLCKLHYSRNWNTGRTDITIAAKGTGTTNFHGYKEFKIAGKKVLEHTQVAEKALGKKLPKGAVVHHVNEDRLDNRPTNLVICPDRRYHALIHARMKALGINFHDTWLPDSPLRLAQNLTLDDLI